MGDLVPISGHDAPFSEDDDAESFVPHDLPDEVDDEGLSRKLVNASEALFAPASTVDESDGRSPAG